MEKNMSHFEEKPHSSYMGHFLVVYASDGPWLNVFNQALEEAALEKR
jgi:hypothetical protein